MIVTKFCRIGTVVRDEQQNVIPGSYRFSFWDEKGKEFAFKLGVPQIKAVAISVEESSFKNAKKETVKFWKFINAFDSVADITESSTAIKAVKELDDETKAMF